MKRLMAVLAIATLSAPAFYAPVPAQAETGKQAVCRMTFDELATDEDFLKMGSDAENVKVVMRNFKADTEFLIKDCSGKDPRAEYSVAMLTLVWAWLMHYRGVDGADTKLELAVQRLVQCSSHYFGEDQGAICDQWEKQAIHWQVMGWPTTGGSADSPRPR
ncbi:MAG: hypothetical protein ABI231_05900 [Candidatus Tumulicola sp.]